MTSCVKGQNLIDSEEIGYDKTSQRFLAKGCVFDRKMIGKTENDRQITL